ncbi:MAG: terpene cyclase/mutase family protein [Thermoguttaceae bacterium]|nr:terpene cyclase/mutase family protein [Thermoguttaceae bacterium]
MKRGFFIPALIAALLCAILSVGAPLLGGDGGEVVVSGEPTPEARAAWENTRLEMTAFGAEYLRRNQEENGGWTTEKGIGTSVVVLLGLLRAGYPMEDPAVERGLDYVLRAVQADGGIYTPGGHIPVYESCLALSCFAYAKSRFGTDRFDAILENGEAFVRGQQYSEENGTSPDDKAYGGLGYGKKSRPDLSNTQFFVDTLRDLGADFNDEAIQRAVTFVERCQNYPSGDENETAPIDEDDAGGFFYTCMANENPAGQETDGGLRSYGSITYAGLKSLIYAGLTESDPRVEAAVGWIRKNYSTTKNPGLGLRGLYYYYHTMSRTMDVLGGEYFADDAGVSHFWKGELIEVFSRRQRPDGSWANSNPMWFESDPNLVTGYALIVLSYCAL